MWPWGHLAVGYLLYSPATRLFYGRPPAGGPTLALVVATQLPDLVDKPLNWWFAVFDGRGVGHSLFLLLPVCLGVYLVTRRYGRGEVGAAVGFGVGTHLAGDALLPVVVGGEQLSASYLLWPLLGTPTYPSEGLSDHVGRLGHLLGHLQEASAADLLTSVFALQLLVVLLLGMVWARDGFPGARTVRNLVVRGSVGRSERR